MADLQRARADLGYFAHAIGHPLAPWQLAALVLETLVTAIVAPRQSGKTRALVVLALWWALSKPEQSIALISASEESSKRNLRLAAEMIAGSPLLSGSVVDQQSGRIVFSNGSRLQAYSLSERSLRGPSHDLLLADEGALHGEADVAAYMPTVAARAERGARVVMASSATTASGPFYDFAVRGESGAENVRTFRWSLSDATWISPSWIQEQREAMTETRFAAEYLGQFASGADALFTRAALDRVTVDYLPTPLDAFHGHARISGGLDFGLTTDRSALVGIARLPVPGERLFGVCTFRRWPAGAPLTSGRNDRPGVVEEIALSPTCFDALTADATGLGGGLAGANGGMLWRLMGQRPAAHGGARQRGGIRLIEEQLTSAKPKPPRRPQPGAFTTTYRAAVFTPDLKASGYSGLRVLIDQERLLIPSSAEDLIRELSMLRIDLNPSGTEKVAASSGHDDLADAAMLSLGPHNGRAGWTTDLERLADPRLVLPDADGPVGGEGPSVRTPGGLVIPRRPVWQSVEGPELTVPGVAPPVPEDLDPARDEMLRAE